MEALDEHSIHIPPFEGIKENVADVGEVNVPVAVEVCHKTNGISESATEDVGQEVCDKYATEALVEATCMELESNDNIVEEVVNVPVPVTEEPVISETGPVDDSQQITNNADDNHHIESLANCDVESGTLNPADNVVIETEVITSNTMDLSGETVSFETELLVEKSETVLTALNNVSDCQIYENMPNYAEGQSLDLNEALTTSEVLESAENNNFSMKEEVFNKEELLDILEGNDLDTAETAEQSSQEKDAEIALKQLHKLKKIGRSPRSKMGEAKSKTTPGKSRKGKKVTENSAPIEKKSPGSTKIEESNHKKIMDKPEEEKNIVKTLVQDWEEDETDDQSQEILKKSEDLLKTTDDLVGVQQGLNMDGEPSERDSVDSSIAPEQDQPLIKGECQTQRRGRIIKKKVIFDPDNPDTFTKGKEKCAIKTKEPQSADKEQPAQKKAKTEQQIILRATSKSPVSKSPWKKPTPKNRQNRRLTEVDKLLMDEGAVNMMYQLTPEAPKGRKNMRTKAEFIKKINQSSTPDGKEMKFRERKKEKIEDSEAKKILVGKQRSSVSGSVTSVSVCEEFDNRPDDSIIYRRHSSSSYSSTCMSPRRLSDVESGTIQSSNQQALKTPEVSHPDGNVSIENGVQETDVFMPDVSETGSNNVIINKKDCLSLKEKLNSKLSTVLHKRKRENKTDKLIKQKKLTLKTDSSEEGLKVPNFKTLSVSFGNNMAEICIKKTGSPNNCCGIEVFTELQEALKSIDKRRDVSLTLLTSESGALCSSLDLQPLLESNMEKRTNYAFEITQSIRTLLLTVQQHSKVLVCGVSECCGGVALSVLVMCDVAVASERAMFALSPRPPHVSPPPPPAPPAPILPGVAVLTAPGCKLSRDVVNELVLFGRQLSASEALQRGLISRTFWPERFYEDLRAFCRDIAAQPLHSLLLKKQLLNINKSPETESKLQSMLLTEQDLIAAYWTSVEGQETLQTHH